MLINFEPGKLTDEISTHVSDVTALEFRRRASRCGMRPSEYLRDLICMEVHGATYDDLMHEHRRAVRAAQGLLVVQAAPNVAASQGDNVVSLGASVQNG